MMCSCPKCAAEIELDIAGIPDEGSYTSCPECKSRFWMGKESFARRALKKEGKLYCSACGKEIDCLTVCTACGIVFPDYYLLQASKPARRQLEKAEFSWSFGAKPAKQTYAIPQKSSSVTPLSRKFLVRAVSLVAIVALAAGGAYVYNQKKTERLYAANYVLALYGIKTGVNLSLSQCARMSADWKAKTDAGQRFAPRLTAEEESRSGRVKNELDPLMLKLDKPPQKFSKASEAITKLYGVQTRLNSLTATPPGSLGGFTDSVSRLDGDFKAAAQELKAGLPKELSEELEKAKTKYKELKDL
jgi:hypothetical protein